MVPLIIACSLFQFHQLWLKLKIRSQGCLRLHQSESRHCLEIFGPPLLIHLDRLEIWNFKIILLLNRFDLKFNFITRYKCLFFWWIDLILVHYWLENAVGYWTKLYLLFLVNIFQGLHRYGRVNILQVQVFTSQFDLMLRNILFIFQFIKIGFLWLWTN